MIQACLFAGVCPDPSHTCTGSDNGIEDVVDRYDKEAKRYAKYGRLASVVGALFELAACIVGILLLLTYQSAASRSGSSNGSVELGVAVLLAAIGFLFLHIAAQFHRSMAESRRLATQLLSVDPYLAPLPRATQILVRAALAQRLFCRIIEDDDPLREPRLPDGEQILSSMKIEPPA